MRTSCAESVSRLLSPLLLVPVRLRRETVESPFTLSAEEDDVLPNHCLVDDTEPRKGCTAASSV